ncbi:Zinc finger C2H2-type [Trinorchestia longiramus]|nr:Zinc finger C2H2-type [Trinorchestia longiramus]
MSSSSGSFTHSSVSSFVPINSSRTKNTSTETCTHNFEDADAPPAFSARCPSASHHGASDEDGKLHCNSSREKLLCTDLHFHNDQLNYFCLPQHVASNSASNQPNKNSSRDVNLGTSSKWVASSTNQPLLSGAETVTKLSNSFVPQVLDQCSVIHKKKLHYQRELLQQQQKQSISAQENVSPSPPVQITLPDLNHLRKTDSIQNNVIASQLFPIFEPYGKDDSLAHFSEGSDHVMPNLSAQLPMAAEQSLSSNMQQRSEKSTASCFDPMSNIGNLVSVSKAVDFTNIYGNIENYQIYGKKTFNSPHQETCKLDFLPKSLSGGDALPTSGATDGMFGSQPYVDLYSHSSYEVCPEPEQFPELSRNLSGGKLISNIKELAFPPLSSLSDDHNFIAKKAFGNKHFIDISGHTMSKTRSDFNVNTLINIEPRNDQGNDIEVQNGSAELHGFQSDRFGKECEASGSRTNPVTCLPNSCSVSKSLSMLQSKGCFSSGTLVTVDDSEQCSTDESSIKSRVETREKDDTLLPFFPVGTLCHSSSEYTDNTYLSPALGCNYKTSPNETEISNDDLNMCLNHLPQYSSSSLAGACDQPLNSTSTSSSTNIMYTSPHPSHNIDNMLNSSSGQPQAVSTSLLSPSVNVPPFHGNPAFYHSSFEDFVQSNLPFYPGLQHFPPSNLNLPPPDIGVPGLHSSSGGKLSQVPSYLGHLNAPLSPASRPMNLASDSSCVYDSPHEPLVPHSVAAPIPIQPLHPAHVLSATHPFPSCLPTSTSILPYPLLQSHSFHDRPLSAPNVHQKLPSTHVSSSTAPTHSVSKILHPTTSSLPKSSSSTLVPHPCLASTSSTPNQSTKLSDRTCSLTSTPSVSASNGNFSVGTSVKNLIYENTTPASLASNRSGSPLNLPVLDIKVTSMKKTRFKVKKESVTTRSRQPPVSKDQFQCNMCNQEFPSSKSLQKHKVVDHNSGSCLECSICKTAFRNRLSLREHRAKHCTRRRYVCQFCNKSFGGSSSLAAHKRIHTGDMPYKCEECGRKFRHLATLKSHRLMHSGERPFQCTLCSLRFSQRGTLAKHFKKHASHPKLKCPLCFNSLKDKDGLARHMKMPHFQCDICEKNFCNRKKLDMHVVKDHDPDGRPFKCDLCPSTFAVRLNYTKHKNSIHREADLVCKECGARFKRRDRFNAHQKIHAPSAPNSSSSKVHICQVCNAKFNQRNSLSKHYRALHGVPPNTESLNNSSVDAKAEEVHPNGNES